MQVNLVNKRKNNLFPGKLKLLHAEHKVMTFDWLAFLTSLTIVGSIFGIISFLLHIWRFLKEKAILKIQVLDCFHYTSKLPKSTIDTHFNINNIGDKNTIKESTIDIEFIIDNIGENSTTIKYIKIIKMKPNEYIYKLGEDSHLLTSTILPHRSERLRVRFDLPKVVLDLNSIEIELEIAHTHGKNKIKTVSRITQNFLG